MGRVPHGNKAGLRGSDVSERIFGRSMQQQWIISEEATFVKIMESSVLTLETTPTKGTLYGSIRTEGFRLRLFSFELGELN